MRRTGKIILIILIPIARAEFLTNFKIEPRDTLCATEMSITILLRKIYLEELSGQKSEWPIGIAIQYLIVYAIYIFWRQLGNYNCD